jgi:hypothetical protein
MSKLLKSCSLFWIQKSLIYHCASNPGASLTQSWVPPALSTMEAGKMLKTDLIPGTLSAKLTYTSILGFEKNGAKC